MTFLQLMVNIVLALLAYWLTSMLLGLIGISGLVGFILSFLVALGVFFANFADRVGRQRGL
jgi:hypothetical protein